LRTGSDRIEQEGGSHAGSGGGTGRKQDTEAVEGVFVNEAAATAKKIQFPTNLLILYPVFGVLR